MEIREAIDDDIPAIVDLLKQSLGESLMPKSVEYWKWKHIDNPFGRSPVLLCIEGSQIIGVRAFMQWRWTEKDIVYKAVRAVDTASHPAHQGKGIFKKLTLKLVDECKQNGFHFVFNTPNEQSKPGYLKMGWEVAGKLPVTIGFRRPFNILRNLALRSVNNELDNDTTLQFFLDHPGLNNLISNDRHRGDGIKTMSSREYLQWRYLKVPVTRYLAIGEEGEGKLYGLLIGRLKNTRFGRELRITDVFFQDDQVKEKLIKALNAKARSLKVDYITLSGLANDGKNILPGLRINGPVGPPVTVRSLMLEDLHKLKEFSHWAPSMGDLELF